MTQLREILFQVSALFTNLFQNPDWRNILDVGLLAILIYQFIKLT